VLHCDENEELAKCFLELVRREGGRERGRGRDKEPHIQIGFPFSFNPLPPSLPLSFSSFSKGSGLLCAEGHDARRRLHEGLQRNLGVRGKPPPSLPPSPPPQFIPYSQFFHNSTFTPRFLPPSLPPPGAHHQWEAGAEAEWGREESVLIPSLPPFSLPPSLPLSLPPPGAHHQWEAGAEAEWGREEQC